MDMEKLKKLLDEHSEAVTAYMKKADERFDKLEKGLDGEDAIDAEEFKKMKETIDDSKQQIEKMRLEAKRPAQPEGELTEEQTVYKKAFDAEIRGRKITDPEEEKMLQTGVAEDGGYLVPVDTDREIQRMIYDESPFRSMATVRRINTQSWRKRFSHPGSTSGWVGEKTTPTVTDTPTLSEREISTHMLYSMPDATQTVLDDAEIDVEAWLAEEVAINFAETEADAFINGNGVDRPKGILAQEFTDAKKNPTEHKWGTIGRVKTGVNGGFKATKAGDAHDNLVELVYALRAPYRRRAQFMANQSTVAEIMKLRDADGRPLWQSNLREGQPDRLMGYSIRETVDMPDIANDAYALCFGDWRKAYTILDRLGVRVLRDPFTAKPTVLFYTTKRVGGDVVDYHAFKALQFST